MSTDDENADASFQSTYDRARREFLRRTALIATAAYGTAISGSSAWAAKPNTDKVRGNKCHKAEAPMKDVEGKVAFITGGSSGIGLGIARAFADAGMKVAFTYRNKSHLDEAMTYLASAGDRVHAIDLDVTDRPGMERAAAETVKTFGKVHVLVNNAGVALGPTVSATSYQDWDWTLNINLNGPFNGVHIFLPLIRSHGEGGQIITTSSVMGLFALSGGGAYTVSKYAVIGMMEALRAELADTNIGTSVFCPGLVDSHILETSLRARSADSPPLADQKMIEEDRQMRANRELAMDPLEAGEIVLRGMRNNDLYILSNPEFEQILRDRSEALIASIPRDLHPTEARLEGAREGFRTSIYTVERDRRLCAATGRANAKREHPRTS
jgi:NAD(P)-dependent dehydrogenase (short-subunit alcohol dehydrogenase family)